MKRLGVPDTAAGRQMLSEHLDVQVLVAQTVEQAAVQHGRGGFGRLVRHKHKVSDVTEIRFVEHRSCAVHWPCDKKKTDPIQETRHAQPIACFMTR